jgi:hypothetical protein
MSPIVVVILVGILVVVERIVVLGSFVGIDVLAAAIADPLPADHRWVGVGFHAIRTVDESESSHRVLSIAADVEGAACPTSPRKYSCPSGGVSWTRRREIR